MPTVVRANDLGRSHDGQAEQLLVQSSVGEGDQTGVTTLVDNLRSAIERAGPPAGLHVHLAGAVAVQVDQQKKTGSTGNQEEALTIVFILVLLLLIFRSLLAPLITIIPAFMAVAISGPLVAEAATAGLKVSQIAQLMLIVLVLGAGTDYGLFLVFRVREELRAGIEPKDAVQRALTRVGESITFSAATVIAALLTLLAATFQIYSQLGDPAGDRHRRDAAGRADPAARAAGHLRPRRVLADQDPGGNGQGRHLGSPCHARRPASRRRADFRRRRLRRAGPRGHRVQAGRLRRHAERPGRHGFGGRSATAGHALPREQRQPDQPRLQA